MFQNFVTLFQMFFSLLLLVFLNYSFSPQCFKMAELRLIKKKCCLLLDAT